MKTWAQCFAILILCGGPLIGLPWTTGCSHESGSSSQSTLTAGDVASPQDSNERPRPAAPVRLDAISSAVRTQPSAANGNSNQLDAVVPTESKAIPQDDPAAAGWAIEPLTVKLDAQLKHFEDLLKPSAEFDVNTLSAANSTIERLRPTERELSFQDDWLVVQRATENGPATTTADSTISTAGKDPSYVGGEGLRQSLITMLEGLKDVRDVRAKAKIVGIKLNDTSAATEIIWQLFATHAEGTLQVNATWECEWLETDQAHPRLNHLRVVKYEETRAQTGGKSPFTDLTAEVVAGETFDRQLKWGVDHWLTRIEERMDIDIAGWQGIALGDVNGDGLDDVYLCQPGGLPNRLYLQNADGTATDVSASSGVDWLDATHGALLVDLDNDLDQDLLVSVTSGVLVMSNDGQGHFTLRAAKVMPAAVPYSLGAADFDQDGDLDVYVCCYNRRQSVNYHLLFARPVPYHDANNGGPNVLLENVATPTTGEWQFQYSTTRVGLDHNNHRFSYAVAWEDYDNDGDLDLYVANDFGRKNLYQNENGRFHDVAPEAGVEDIGPGMSTCWGDYNNDGWMDLYVSNMFSSAGNRITEQSRFQQGADEATREAFRRHARGNTLFSNRGDGTFEDVSVSAGVVLGRWAWGSRFVDLNNDGWQDLVVANGFITQPDTDDL